MEYLFPKDGGVGVPEVGWGRKEGDWREESKGCRSGSTLNHESPGNPSSTPSTRPTPPPSSMVMVRKGDDWDGLTPTRDPGVLTHPVPVCVSVYTQEDLVTPYLDLFQIKLDSRSIFNNMTFTENGVGWMVEENGVGLQYLRGQLPSARPTHVRRRTRPHRVLLTLS